MITLPIVGARYRPPAEEVLKLLPSGTKLLLRRQPDNPYDENAVQVILPGDANRTTAECAAELYGNAISALLYEADQSFPLHLGFIPREAAKELAPRMDDLYGGNKEYENPELDALLTFGLTGLPNVSFGEPK